MDLALPVIVCFQQWQEKVADHIMPEIRGDVAHLQTPLGNGSILVIAPGSAKWRAMAAFVFAVLGEEIRGRGPETVMKAREKAAVDARRGGCQVHRLPVGRDGLLGETQAHECVAQAVVKLHSVRVQSDSPPTDRGGIIEPPAAQQQVAQIVPGQGEVRPQIDRPLIGCDGLVGEPPIPQRVAEIVMRLRKARLEVQRAAARGDRLIRFVMFIQGHAQIAVRLGIVRPAADRIAVGGDRFVELALVLERGTQAVMRLREVGLELNRETVCGGCLAKAVEAFQGVPKIQVCRRHIGPDSDRPVNQTHRSLMVPGLAGDDSQQVQRIEMIRLDVENLPVNDLRFRQPARLVVLDRDAESLRDAHNAGNEDGIANRVRDLRHAAW